MFQSEWIIIRELECLYMKLLGSSYLRYDVNSVHCRCTLVKIPILYNPDDGLIWPKHVA